MNQAVNEIIEDLNQYRFCGRDTVTEKEYQGTFLFADPSEARDTRVALVSQFPTYQIWLEDRQGRVIEIPKR